MDQFSEGDRVRIDFPDETDPDHSQYHGNHGTIVSIIEDHAGKVTGDEQDSALVRVELESGNEADFRRRDLRPPIE
jgi:ribosomal protein L21E